MHNCPFKINLVDFLVMAHLNTVLVTVVALVCDMMGTIAVAGFTVAVQIVTAQTALYESRKQVYLLCLVASISPLAGLHRPSNLVKGLHADDCIKSTLYSDKNIDTKEILKNANQGDYVEIEIKGGKPVDIRYAEQR